MDSVAPVQSAVPQAEEDKWDSDDFVIPSLGIQEANKIKTILQKVEDPKPSKVQAGKDEKIYLGPHGGRPHPEKSPFNRKQKFKQKIREADKRYGETGRENKVDSIRELVGSRKMPMASSKGSGRDWLDPHCQESQFERKQLH